MSNIIDQYIRYISATILREPEKKSNGVNKGAIILNKVDEITKVIPELKEYFYIIERRGWEGISESKTADIKFVDDLSTWEETKKRFPNAVLLDIGAPDFIDTEAFRPLGVEKDYDGIQISSWDEFKRPFLFIQGAALIPNRRFLRLGHYINKGTPKERALRNDCLEMTKKLGANIEFPFGNADSNEEMPKNKDDINLYINSAKMGILTTKAEGINRFKLECLSADIPVLIPSDTSYPTKKHINDDTGLLFDPSPESLAEAVEYVISHRSQFNPREYVLKNTGINQSLKKLKKALSSVCEKDGAEFIFDNIYWDGRNQSLLWGITALKKIKEVIEKTK
jgi:hypothetical protein